ncbi:hypothetical protein GCM10011332_26890 [Terasakiella brassicae]|uniref:Cytoskeleton protein RodZ-like C-terminal domain-containing protein n=2 Tax=Terasakiella brassicae TaxID=1634917 RepID=A0A917C5N2_9PROT|nr:helix-turn-helix domain-containing protein [Terasakiella brassicae]GGF71546.1 hypothetical protein GCM10011332_26890 [Terasakiella brassicae]
MMRNKGRNAQQEPAFTGPGVSELLKTTRERAGQDLQVISQVLRIRYIYLEAIEGGRYDELPGKTYVIGFVRAYAEHLGLDSNEVVKRFKQEVDGLEGRSELMFPSPVTEQSVPGGAIIMIGLVVLAAAYGGWYFLSSQDRSVAELVPDLPAKFSEMMDRVKNGQQEETPAPVETAQEPTTPEQAPSVSNEQVSETDAQDMAQKAMESLEKAKAETKKQEQGVETVKLNKKANDEAVTQEQAEQVQAVPQNTVEETAEKAVEAVEEKVEETVAAVPADAETLTTPAVETEEPAAATEEKTEETSTPVTPVVENEAPAEPQVMTEKVMLKAVDYSWIQVTDADGNVIHTQVLNEGEEYQIPQTQGLILRTGNAGGLEIYVDGTKVPSIGEAGEVRRKVLINPEKLLAGKAVES